MFCGWCLIEASPACLAAAGCGLRGERRPRRIETELPQLGNNYINLPHHQHHLFSSACPPLFFSFSLFPQHSVSSIPVLGQHIPLYLFMYQKTEMDSHPGKRGDGEVKCACTCACSSAGVYTCRHPEDTMSRDGQSDFQHLLSPLLTFYLFVNG